MCFWASFCIFNKRSATSGSCSSNQRCISGVNSFGPFPVRCCRVVSLLAVACSSSCGFSMLVPCFKNATRCCGTPATLFNETPFVSVSAFSNSCNTPRGIVIGVRISGVCWCISSFVGLSFSNLLNRSAGPITVPHLYSTFALILLNRAAHRASLGFMVPLSLNRCVNGLWSVKRTNSPCR